MSQNYSSEGRGLGYLPTPVQSFLGDDCYWGGDVCSLVLHVCFEVKSQEGSRVLRRGEGQQGLWALTHVQ